MAPKPASTTARDLELLVFAWQSLKTPPQVDYDAFAQKAGYKNAATASTQFNTLKKKLFAIAAASSSSDGTTNANASDGSRPGTPSTPSRRGRGGGATPGSRKRGSKGVADAEAGSGDDGVDDSPTKKRKTAARGKTETGSGDDGDDGGDAGEARAEV